MKPKYICFSLFILPIVLFLFPVILSAKPPDGAVKIVILKTNDSTVGTPATITIEAQKSNNKVDESYQNDVILNTSGSATGGGLVDIVNGVGTIEINDLVAETVVLSLSEAEPSGLDISSTREVDFAPVAEEGADLSITMSDSPDPVTAGDTITYTITVANNGPDNAMNVVVSDTLPPALISPSIDLSQGVCNAFPCNLNTIPKDHAVVITITSPVDASASGAITNIASVSSDTEDSVTSNNVATQDTVVSPLSESPAPSGGGGGSAPTTVIFSGKAFPGAKVLVVDKDIKSEITVSQSIVANEEGNFSVSFIGVLQSQHSFGLMIKDKENRATQTKFFDVDTLANNLTIKDILSPPTVGLWQRLVSRGKPAIIVGSASPNNKVIIEIDDKIKKEAKAEKDGSYKALIDSGELEFGAHHVRVKQVDINQDIESDYSPTNAFVVSRLTVPKTDLSGDGVVDIKDWSMFLSKWTAKDDILKKTIDLNDDGKVDISDFSIFIRTIKKIK